MKKSFMSALAALSLVACVQEEVVNVPQTDAITFAQVAIDNATRAAVDPSTTTASINAFKVWGFMDEPSGLVFDGEEVQKSGNTWTYANIQYWAPEHTYYFAALSPVNGANWTLDTAGANEYGAGQVAFTNVDGTEDLIYAATKVNTPVYDELKLGNMEPVKFQFNHLLSKIKFTFTNGFLTDNVSVEVNNIKMTVPKTGEIDLAVENWWDNDDWTLGTETVDLAFGNVASLASGKSDECANERLTIPTSADQEYAIEFEVVLYMGDKEALRTTKTSSVTGVAIEMGKAYNFTAEINPDNLDLSAIEFDVVEVKAWEEPAIDVEHPIVAMLNDEPYSSLQSAIDAATAADNTIFLVANVKENVTISQTADINLVIDGQEHTYQGTMRVSGRSAGTSPETLTIKNIDFVNYTADPSIDQYWGTANQTRYGHNITIANCTFTMAGAAEHTAVAIDLYQPYNITVTDVEVTGAASLLQSKGGHDGISVSNVKITDCKNGIGFGTHDGTVSVTGAEMDVLGYGIRVDGTQGDLQVKDVNIKALRPIIVRKITANSKNKVTISGTNTITPGDYYHVVFTAGDDDVAYIAPAADNYELVCSDALKVYPANMSEWVNNQADLESLLAAETPAVTLGNGNFDNIKILNDGTTITGSEGTVVGCINLNGKKNVTLKNIEFDASKALMNYDGGGTARQYANIISGDQSKNKKGSRNLVIDGCTFTGQFTNGGAAISFADRNRTSGQSGDITIKNCTFNTTGAYYDIYGYYSGYGSFIIENNTFKSAPQGRAIYLGRYQSSTPVVVKGNTFENDATIEDAVYLQDHSSYGVSLEATSNTFAD